MGRRTLYIMGLAILDVLLLMIGIWALLGVGGRDLAWAKWAQAVTQMVFYGCYTAFIGSRFSSLLSYSTAVAPQLSKNWLTVYKGPVCYSIVGEASSTRLRNKTVALGRITYAIFTLAMNILNTYMINASAWNWQGKTAFFCELRPVSHGSLSSFISSVEPTPLSINRSSAHTRFSPRAPYLLSLYSMVLLPLARVQTPVILRVGCPVPAPHSSS